MFFAVQKYLKGIFIQNKDTCNTIEKSNNGIKYILIQKKSQEIIVPLPVPHNWELYTEKQE
jgi:hypothetical protein